MSLKLLRGAVAVALAGGLLAGVAQAEPGYEAGTWIARAGAWGIFPKSDNLNTALGTINVDDGYSLGFNFTYMATPNIGIELLLALPFNHDIKLGGTTVGSTDQLPPTLFLQYYFMPTGTVHPYVGVGLNYTFFFNEDTTGPLTGTDLSLDGSWGVAGQAGIDIDVAPGWFVNAEIDYIDIDSKAKVDGVGLGTVSIDPWVVGLNIGTRF